MLKGCIVAIVLRLGEFAYPDKAVAMQSVDCAYTIALSFCVMASSRFPRKPSFGELGWMLIEYVGEDVRQSF